MGKAAEAARVPFRGGPLGAGRDFTASFFSATGTDVSFHDPEAEKLYRGFLADSGAGALGELTVPLVATFGFAVHFVATRHNWHPHRRADGSFPPGYLTSDLFAAVVRAWNADAIAFYRFVTGLGVRVLAVLPPQRVPRQSDPEVFFAAQECVREAVAATGAEIVDVRPRTAGPDRTQLPRFCLPNDEIHGNLAFGRIVLSDLLARGL
ncbi:hypothetical protein [Dactylosporangium sp. CA-092794]|uniref:hypothetical protein n=1 Tax=Dactylosporangium sp. CA-092794 TaxID=3239929 RepID=UPI003D8EA4DF